MKLILNSIFVKRTHKYHLNGQTQSINILKFKFVQNKVTAVIQNVVGKFFELNDDLLLQILNHPIF